MAEPFIAEVRIFGCNFAPRGWAFCNGQLIEIQQNTALFSLLGTTYGGDGRTTFEVPNLQGRAPMHPGRGPGLTPRQQGEMGGVINVTLTQQQIPSHRQTLQASEEDGRGTSPVGDAPGVDETLYTTAAQNTTMAAQSLPKVGGNGAHTNQQPYQVLNFCIALTGTYPE
jgi:microcystin-dependent protein